MPLKFILPRPSASAGSRSADHPRRLQLDDAISLEIVEAAGKIRQKQFVLDEAVVLGVDGISDFNALHSRRHDEEVQFCAFDILAEGGEDLRKLPLSMRKTNLERLLARRPEGIFINPFERGA